MADLEVKFDVTPNIRAAVHRVVGGASKLGKEHLEHVEGIRQYQTVESKEIPFSALKTVSKLHLLLFPTRSGGDVAENGRISSLLKGTRMSEKKKTTTYTPEFEKTLEQMRAKQDRLEYLNMVKTLPQRQLEMKGTFSNFSQVTKDLSVGMNVILVMFTGFMVFYYVGKMSFPNNHVFAVGCGALGLIAAMLLETFIILLRDRQTLIMEDRDKKDFFMGARTTINAINVTKPKAIKAKKLQPAQPPLQQPQANASQSSGAAAPVPPSSSPVSSTSTSTTSTSSSSVASGTSSS